MRWFHALFFTSFASALLAAEPAVTSKTICLNMIVKDETAVIERCLNSVKDLIDYWVIVDTGSSDGTQAKIKALLAGIPGELYERPWVDFGHNRQEALLLAKGKGDYLMFIDADDMLEVHTPLDKRGLDKECYVMSIRYDHKNIVHKRIVLIDNKLDAKWEGVLHEQLVMANPLNNFELFSAITAVTYQDGHRSHDPQKVDKDIAVLERALEKEPDNTRYAFYLAQSYANKGDALAAMHQFERRALMPGGWDKEIFWSIYAVAQYQELLEYHPDIFIQNYSQAFHYDQSRAEPLFRLAGYFNRAGLHAVSYAIASFARSIPIPQDEMYIERDIYDHRLTMQLAYAAYMIGHKEEAKRLYQEALERFDLPEPLRKEILTLYPQL